jgi:hypothetical protein
MRAGASPTAHDAQNGRVGVVAKPAVKPAWVNGHLINE